MNKTAKLLRRIVSFVLTLAVTAGLCLSPAWARTTDFFDEFPKDVPAEALTVTEPDDSKFTAAFDAYNKALAENAPAEDVSARFAELTAQFNTLSVLYVACFVAYCAHPAEYEEIYSKWEELSSEVDNRYVLAVQAGLDSVYADMIADSLGAIETKKYKKIVTDTPEELAMLNECAKQLTDFWAAMNTKYTYFCKEKTWTSESAVEAYNSGELSFDDYREIEIQLAKQKNAKTVPIYIKIMKLKNSYAASKGYKNYAEFAYPNAFGRDYTTEDAQRFCNFIKQAIPELQSKLKIIGRYNADLSESNLASITGISGEENLALLRAHLPEISSEYADLYDYMVRNGLYDIEHSDEKLAMGYTISLPGYNSAFIFNSPYGNYYDLKTVIHEFGHYAEYCLAEAVPLCNDAAETNSQGLETLFLRFSDDMVGSGGDAFRWAMISTFISNIVSAAAMDEFERAAYAAGDLDIDGLNRLYRKISEQYGFEFASDDGMAYSWSNTSHIFDTPFYYLSYAISAITSLEILERSQTDFTAAADTYLAFTKGTADMAYCELVKSCGLSDIFKEGTVNKILDGVFDYILFEAADAVRFNDVAGHWFKDGAYLLSACSILNGSDGSLEPESATTRAMLAALLHRIGGSPNISDAPALSDVSESDWFYTPAVWTVQNGFLKDEGGKFSPDATVTREELAGILMRFLDAEEVNADESVLNRFADGAGVSDGARNAVAWAIEKGIILGSDGRLEPTAAVTRAECAQMLLRLL